MKALLVALTENAIKIKLLNDTNLNLQKIKENKKFMIERALNGERSANFGLPRNITDDLIEQVKAIYPDLEFTFNKSLVSYTVKW